jgi:hypothetical protein
VVIATGDIYWDYPGDCNSSNKRTHCTQSALAHWTGSTGLISLTMFDIDVVKYALSMPVSPPLFVVAFSKSFDYYFFSTLSKCGSDLSGRCVSWRTAN